MEKQITPFLWFDHQAEEAANFYTSTFANSTIGSITRASKAGFKTHGLPEGKVMTIEFKIESMRFVALNGGPLFKFNPSISFLVACTTKEEVDALWTKLSQGGGPALIELGSYPFSERYGWLQDRYGLSWQVMFTREHIKQKIVPTLMFTGEQSGKAEMAINLYTAIFPDSSVEHIMRYLKGEGPDIEGTVRHAGFTLEGEEFAAMDSARVHNFTFNEAISLMVECRNQEDIDYYWGKLTSEGKEGVCGWLTDRFGVSWQVVPTILNEMLRDPDREKAARVTEAFLKMKKFNISQLKKAFSGK